MSIGRWTKIAGLVWSIWFHLFVALFTPFPGNMIGEIERAHASVLVAVRFYSFQSQ